MSKSKREDMDPELSRKKAFMESKFNPSNQKYGLFSYTGTLAISERPYFSQLQSYRDTDGKVKTGPKNLYSSPGKQGKTSDVYFSPSQYYSDAYKGLAKPYLRDRENAEGMRKVHSVSWKPGGSLAEPLSLFESLPTLKEKKINKRGPDGKVLLEPKNFMTAPLKKGNPNSTPGVLFGQEYEHLADPYNRQKQLAYEEHLKNKSKMQTEQFKGMDPGGKFFSSIEETFGGDLDIKKKAKNKSESKVSTPFYSMVSKVDCFQKFPEHMADQRVPFKKDDLGDKPSWKSTTKIRTIPSPSVSCSLKNLRKEFPVLRRVT